MAETQRRNRIDALAILVRSSITQQPKRSLLQILLVAAVVLTGGACLIAGQGGGQSIVNSVDTSGASLYQVSANNRDTNSPEPVDTAVLDTLERVTGLNGVSAQTSFEPTVQPATELPGQRRTVLAVSPNYTGFRDATVVAGLPVFAPNARPYGVLLGQDIARDLGVTPSCTQQQSCELRINGDPFIVSAIITSETQNLGQAILIDLQLATNQGHIEGAEDVRVSSNGLPATTTRRSLDLILSQSTDQVIFVQAPSAAAALREGVSATWQRTIAAMAVLVLAMGVAGQIAIQRSIVRSRHIEIATLRSIGYPPRFIITQFVAEPLILAAAGAVLGAIGLGLADIAALNIFDYDLDLPATIILVLASNALIVSAGASMLAAHTASQISPSEVLHR